MPFSTGELIGLAVVGGILTVIVGAYMIISRKKGWMRED